MSIEELVPPSFTAMLPGVSNKVELDRERVAVIVTVPEKPLLLVALIMDTPVLPGFTVRLVAFADITKDGTM
jgi:hypothetical protein